MDKNILVKSLLEQYFYYKDCFEQKIQEIEDTWHKSCGVHSPSMSGIHVAPEDKGSKILRVGEDKIKPLEKEKGRYEMQMKNLYQVLHLYELEDVDYELLEHIYRYQRKYEEIAKIIGYTDKAYVSRKRTSIERGIEKYV